MTNKKLLQAGYKPAKLIVLHDSGTIIKTHSSAAETPWWKEYFQTGKAFVIDGDWLQDLADMLGIETNPLKTTGHNGGVGYQGLSSMRIPIGNLEIEDNKDHYVLVEKVFAKIENGALHLAACFECEEFVFSSHGGSFEVAWDGQIEEATA